MNFSANLSKFEERSSALDSKCLRNNSCNRFHNELHHATALARSNDNINHAQSCVAFVLKISLAKKKTSTGHYPKNPRIAS